jgi:uncharacterized protein YndB with AHSA1/START domain
MAGYSGRRRLQSQQADAWTSKEARKGANVPRLRKTVLIERPIDEVFAYVADQANVAEWQEGVVESVVLAGQQMGVGTNYQNTLEMFGHRFDVSGELTAYEPHTRFSFKNRSSSMPASGTFTFREVRGGTEVTLVTEVRPKGLAGLAGPLVTGTMDGMLRTSFQRLKNILESTAWP